MSEFGALRPMLDLIERYRRRRPFHPIPSDLVQSVSRLKSRVCDSEIEHLRLRHPDIADLLADRPDMVESFLKKTGKVTAAFDRILYFANKTGLHSYPGKFQFDEGSGSVQLPRSLLFDPNYKGAAYRIRSDSPHKEAIQNTGMSGAGGSKGKGGEPTKDDEVANTRTMALKLGLSVEAVTPNFIASAKIRLEMKSDLGSGSGSGSNSKPPPLPPMPTPLVCKLYDSFLGVKKKFID